MADRKSVKIRHLSARNLTLGMSPKLTDTAKDRGVLAVPGPASFVGFPSFYMQPDKTARNVGTLGPGRKAGDLSRMVRYGRITVRVLLDFLCMQKIG